MLKKTYKDEHGYLRFKNSGKLVSRWIAEKKIGRKLKFGEVVHHIDTNKFNNNPDNLHVFANQSEHEKEHFAMKLEKLTRNCLAFLFTLVIAYFLLSAVFRMLES